MKKVTYNFDNNNGDIYPIVIEIDDTCNITISRTTLTISSSGSREEITYINNNPDLGEGERKHITGKRTMSVFRDKLCGLSLISESEDEFETYDFILEISTNGENVTYYPKNIEEGYKLHDLLLAWKTGDEELIDSLEKNIHSESGITIENS